MGSKRATALGIGMIGLLSGMAWAAAPEAGERETQTIQCEVRTEQWKGWGEGEAAPRELAVEPTPAKFERFATPAGAAPTFSGKVIGIPPGKTARVVVVANVGTQWINTANYKAGKVAPDGSFVVVADHKPDADKSIMASIDGRLATFLRAEFEPDESATAIELRLPETKRIVITMEDPRGRAMPGFRYEVFNPYVWRDDAGRTLRTQRLASGTASGGALVLDAPLEPFAVLLSANGVAPYYQVLDPRAAEAFHFKMIAPARVRGVVMRDGKPVPGQEMYMVNRAAPLSVTLRKTDANGRFDFGGRVPGQQDIRAGAFTTSVQVQPGETADVDIDLGAATQAAVPVVVAPATPATRRSPVPTAAR
jgi:hypothetical protein